jgi:hypothetical protein
VPAGLSKRGLRSLSDNLPPGARVAVDSKVFLRLFRVELEQRLGTPAAAAAAKGRE